MLIQIAIGLGAGAASALLYFAVISGTPLAFALFYLAPLPVIVAGLGWGWFTALVAAMSGAAFAAITTAPLLGLAFLVACGAPAAWLTRLTLLGRPVDESDPAAGIEWYPAGRLILWIAGLGSGVVLLGTLVMGGGTEALRHSVAEALERLAADQAGPALGLSEDIDIGELSVVLAAVLPAISAVVWTLTMMLNLWLGGRIAIASGLLARPMPVMAELEFPSIAAGVLALSLIATFMPGMIGIVGGVVAAALIVAYFILGLIVVHAVTRDMGGRAFILAALYLTIMVLFWTVPLIAALGVADTFLKLRERASSGTTPPH
jgi:hypothetical protein